MTMPVMRIKLYWSMVSGTPISQRAELFIDVRKSITTTGPSAHIVSQFDDANLAEDIAHTIKVQLKWSIIAVDKLCIQAYKNINQHDLVTEIQKLNDYLKTMGDTTLNLDL